MFNVIGHGSVLLTIVISWFLKNIFSLFTTNIFTSISHLINVCTYSVKVILTIIYFRRLNYVQNKNWLLWGSLQDTPFKYI